MPTRGLEQALHLLAPLFAHPRVVAVGPIGLGHGGPAAEHALRRQLDLARELNRPVVVRLESRAPGPQLQRILVLLHEAETELSSVIVAGSSRHAVQILRECSLFASLRLRTGVLSPRMAAELVSRHGSEGLLLGSGSGGGAADLLALPKAASALAKAGVPPSVSRRVLFGNALSFFRIDPAALN